MQAESYLIVLTLTDNTIAPPRHLVGKLRVVNDQFVLEGNMTPSQFSDYFLAHCAANPERSEFEVGADPMFSHVFGCA